MGNNPDIPNELYYLDDNFSVRSLRKYQLKEILAANNIPYLSSITRVDLINLFKKNIEPRREEILREYTQKKAQKHASEAQEEYGRGQRAKAKYVEPSTTSLHEKDADGFKIPNVPTRRTPPKFNAEDSFASSDDDVFTAAPQRKTTAPVKERTKKPVVVAKKATSTKRAKFSPPAFNAEDSFASSGDEEDDEFMPVTIKASEKRAIIQDKKAVEDVEEEVVEDEDEDTDYNADTDDSDEDEDLGSVDKEELVLLYKDQAVPPEVFISSDYHDRSQTLAVAAERFSIWKARLTHILYALCTLYMIFGSIGLVITSIARKNNGYCNNYYNEVNTTENDGLFSILPSSCIPCPDHGVCKGGELICDTLYEKKTPIYNLGHVFPIADDCVHNSVLGKYVAKVERHIKQKLATEQGKATCEHLFAHPESPGEIPPTRVAVKDIIEDLNATIKSHLPAEKMEEILVIALSVVLEDPKIHFWETENNERFLGTDHVKYTISCQAKRLYKTIPIKVKAYIFGSTLGLSVVAIIFQLVKQKIAAKHKVDNMLKAITNQLKQQYENHSKDPTKYPSPAISGTDLRSSIVDVHDPKTITDWQRVLKEMKDHPHIKRSFVEMRGDPVEYWELTA